MGNGHQVAQPGAKRVSSSELKARMKPAIVRLFAVVAVTTAALFATPALAEQTLQQQQQERTLTQPYNNAPVWKEVRGNQAQTTSLPGRETNVLIQPQGQTWRALHNSKLAVYGGWALVAMFLVIVAYYFIKGVIELPEPETGRKVLRFNAWERTAHWTTAICFVILACSGLIILFGKTVLLPIIGYTLFSWLAVLAKNLHNFVGPLFVISIVLTFVTFLRDNWPRRGDWQWLIHFGGLFGGHTTPSHRFNALEKLWFWFGLLTLGFVMGASGFVLDFPNFDQTRQTMQTANVVHVIGATLFVLGAMGHIYMGTIGMAGAYRAMRDGYVDETWAKVHHELWYQDIKAGKIPADMEPSLPAASTRSA